MKLCECGCGNIVKNEFNKFILGHNKSRLGQKSSEESKQKNRLSHIGKIKTLETKIKISESLKGKNTSKQSIESIEKRRLKLLGRKQTKETIEKRSKIMKGKNKGYKRTEESINKQKKTVIGKYAGSNNWNFNKKHSDEHKRKNSEAKKGSKHPLWLGGISNGDYCPIFSDKEFKQMIKDRDGNKCLNPYCNNKHKELHIHHINYDKQECNESNLITVCRSCNSKANTDRDWHKEWYSTIIKNRYK